MPAGLLHDRTAARWRNTVTDDEPFSFSLLCVCGFPAGNT